MDRSAHAIKRRPEATDDLLQRLLGQSRDHALILLDPHGRIVDWLAGAEHMFGYTGDEMVGEPVERLFTPEDVAIGAATHEREVANAVGKGEDDRWLVRKDGTRIWVTGVLTALREGDRIVGYGKVLRDRTDVKTQIDALENRIASLGASNDRKSLFVSKLVHELRNPLSSMLGAVRLARMDTAAGPKSAQALDVLQRQIDFLTRLVDDLMDAAGIETGKLELRLQILSVNQVITEATESLRPLAEARSQSLDAITLPAPVHVNADPDRLRQVFFNLITNSIKYTPEGGHIWVKQTTEGDEVVVRVEDSGIGMTAEILPKVFELFTQDESARPMSEGGLGVGLALVRELVALHGGLVQVRSEGRNKGSEFTVRLPLHRG
jgi:PAS domain S-box-containing protein